MVVFDKIFHFIFRDNNYKYSYYKALNTPTHSLHTLSLSPKHILSFSLSKKLTRHFSRFIQPPPASLSSKLGFCFSLFQFHFCKCRGSAELFNTVYYGPTHTLSLSSFPCIYAVSLSKFHGVSFLEFSFFV